MPKSTKRFVLHTSGLNSEGFRMLTEGVDLSAFEKNPVLLFNHTRPNGNLKNQILPLGYWTDIKVDGDEISAVPFFDDKDDFAMQIYNKVEADILRMCSVGAQPLELSDDPALVLAGQERETVIKWRLKEVSICDIGANPDSLVVALYDTQAQLIQLSAGNMDTFLPKIKTMNKPAKTAAQIAAAKKGANPATPPKKKAVALADSATDPAEEDLEDDDSEEELSDEDKDAVIADLTAKLNDAMEQLRLAQEERELADAEEEEKKCETLVNKAIASKRITLAQKADYIALAKSNYESTAKVLGELKAYKSVKTTLTAVTEEDAINLTEISKKSYDELFKSGELMQLKDKAPDIYRAKHKAKFGKEPKNL